MTPSFAIFRKVFEISQKNTEHLDDKEPDRTYDYLPDAKAKYPFVYIGEDDSQRVLNTDFMEEVEQTIHLWGRREHRNTLDGLTVAIHDDLQRTKQAFDYSIKMQAVNKQTIPDNTTGEPLLHYVMTVRFLVIKN